MADASENQEGTPARPPAPGESFVCNELGRGSSHPEFAIHRLRWAKRLAFSAGLVVVAVVAWHLREMRAGKWNPDIRSTFLPFQALVDRHTYTLGLAFAVSAVLTAALTIRASIVRGSEAPPRRPFLAWSEGLVLMAVVVVICTVVAWLARPGFLTTTQRILLVTAGVLPLFVLRFWFDLHPRVGPKEEGKDKEEEEKEGMGILRGFFRLGETAFEIGRAHV